MSASHARGGAVRGPKFSSIAESDCRLPHVGPLASGNHVKIPAKAACGQLAEAPKGQLRAGCDRAVGRWRPALELSRTSAANATTGETDEPKVNTTVLTSFAMMGGLVPSVVARTAAGAAKAPALTTNWSTPWACFFIRSLHHGVDDRSYAVQVFHRTE